MKKLALDKKKAEKLKQLQKVKNYEAQNAIIPFSLLNLFSAG
jgi:hypothetical protein